MPSKLRDVVERLSGFSKVPVNYAGKFPIAPEGIPRGQIAVADDLAWLPVKVRDVPLNILWRNEVLNCLMISSYEGPNLNKAIFSMENLRPRTIGNFSRKEGQNLSAILIETQDLRKLRQACLLKMAQKGMDRGRPAIRGAADSVANANHLIDHA